MKQIVTLLLILSSLGLFSQPVYYVTPGGNDDNDGSSWATSFRTVQKALAVSTTGQIWVAVGTYYPDEGPGQTDNDRFSTFNLKTGVAVYGGFMGYETDTSQRNYKINVTILSGDIDNVPGIAGNSYHVVRAASVNNNGIIDGFTITGGNANGNAASEYDNGGGIYCSGSDPVISNCNVTRNTASDGAGIYADGGFSPTLFNCNFSANIAQASGGGMFNRAVGSAISNCSFSGNTAKRGGGIYNFAAASVITNCSFGGNSAEFDGGGVYNSGASAPTFVNCSISGNEAFNAGAGIYNEGSSPKLTDCSINGNWCKYFGGGIFNSSSSPVITRCGFTQNTALLFGGGIYNGGSASPVIVSCSFSKNEGWEGGGAIFNSGSATPYPRAGKSLKESIPVTGGKVANKIKVGSPNIVNSSFWRNHGKQGGGIANFLVSPSITNCSFSGNTAATGGAIAVRDGGSMTTIINCIVWGNSGAIVNLAGYAMVTSSLIEGGYGWEDTTSLDVDPLFVDAANGDLRLQPASPAIDAGNNAAVTTTTDVDGNPRIAGARVDMGAYEYSPPPAPITLTCPAAEGAAILKTTGIDNCIYIIQGNELDVVVGGSSAGPFTHSYTLTGATTTPDPVVSPSLDGVLLNKGETIISWLVRDAGANEANCSFKIMVTDNTPPLISTVTTNTPVLFPTDLKMQDITLEYTTSDNCGPVTTTLSVSSNEPENNHPPHPGFVKHGVIFGDGNTVPDWQVIDDHHLKLNTKNSIRSGGRVYTITITATDAAGNTSTATVTVSVPRHTRANIFTDLVITARPNPSTNNFSLVTHSSSEQPMKIKVVDNVGRVIERRSGVSPAGTFYLGSTYKPGVYFVEIIQGATVKTLKLVKQAR